MRFEVNDWILSLADGLTTKLRRQAREQAITQAVDESRQWRWLLTRLRTVAEDPDKTDREVRQYVLGELSVAGVSPVSLAWRQREAIITNAARVRRLLNAILRVELAVLPGSPIETLILGYRTEAYHRPNPLPDPVVQAMPRRWRQHLSGRNTAGSHAVFNASLLIGLQRALKNGSLWARESTSYRSREAGLIDRDTWTARRTTYYGELGLPLDARTWLRQRLDLLASSLEGAHAAIASEQLRMDERGVVLEPIAAERTDRAFERARKRLIASADTVDFPDLIVEIDRSVRFSWQLLQRPPRSAQALLAVYGALLVHGTERSIAEVSLMMPQVSDIMIADALPLLERSIAGESSITNRW